MPVLRRPVETAGVCGNLPEDPAFVDELIGDLSLSYAPASPFGCRS